MSYWSLYYHFIWATKDRLPLVSVETEAEVYRLIRGKAKDLHATVWALGGMPDHIHLVVSVPPNLSLSRFIGQVKAATSAIFNKTHEPNALLWQHEFGVFSFDRKKLEKVTDYVNSQKAHHSAGTVITSLERASRESV